MGQLPWPPKATDLEPIRLHDLRHGAATLMLAAGIDVKIVSDTLGHSDTRITRDIYQSVLPKVGKNAAEAAGKAAKVAMKVREKTKAQAKEKRMGKGRKHKK
ncbi:tyrosine-type recombinase/integrase [Streptomyces lunaelactis]|uniref:tyrosine-type recombinase/integrase n=1 Tax=Streptomyces lunaelactis TaxID=1535768 RepID=UPI00158519B6|nr:tyrosine-type recombinase/integrase [Streptomyces lunaelactis]